MMKRLMLWVGIAIGVLLVVAIALPFLIDPNMFRPALESEATRALGRPVKLGSLKLSILSGGVTADDLSIADDPAYSQTAFLQAKSVKIGVELLPLIFSRKLNVNEISIDAPQVALIESPGGEWNYSTLGSKSGPTPPAASSAPSQSLDLSVKLVKVANGRFSLGRTTARYNPLVLDKVNAELRDFSGASAFPYSFSAAVLGGGEIKLDGTVGPLKETDLSRTPVTANLKISQFDLAGSGWTQAVPGMAGIVSLDGSLVSNGAAVTLKGRIQADKLKLAQQATAAARPVELEFAVEHRLPTRSGTLTQGTIRIGGANASLTGTYASQGESTVLRMNLDGPSMSVPDLAAMLPALGIALPGGSSLKGGAAAVKLAMEGPADRLVTTGTIALDNTTLAGFDLGRKMALIETLAGMKASPDTEIKHLGGSLRMGPDGIAADNLQLIVPAIGEIAGAGTIGHDNALDFRMTAKVHTAGIMAAVADTAVPFLVQGVCADPVFRPDIKSVVAGQAKTVGMKAAGSLLKGLFGGKK
jgi:AsmA protein